MNFYLLRICGIAAALTLPAAKASPAQTLPAPGVAEAQLLNFQVERTRPPVAGAELILLPGPSVEPSRPAARSWKKTWIASWVAFAAINALDAHSSAGRAEANPLLRSRDGRFSGGKAALVKTAAGGGFLAVQWWAARKHPERYRTFTIANTALNGGLAAIVVRNYRLPPPPVTPPGYVLKAQE